jgi:hypothetical protein
MPLSSTQITQIFEIVGVPQDGNGAVFSSVATLFGPAYENYDMAAIVTQINTKLAALSATQITRCTELLDRFTAITATSPLTISDSSAGKGVIVNHPQERSSIRESLGNLLGIAVPSGGFMAEAKRVSSPVNSTSIGR